MKIRLFFALVVALSSVSHPECYLTHHVFRATLTLVNGSSFTAYVIWSECWGKPVSDSIYPKKFFKTPSIVDTQTLFYYPDGMLHAINYPPEITVASTSKPLILPLDSLRNLRFLTGGMHDGKSAEIPVATRAAVRMLQREPTESAKCECNDPCHVFLLNYGGAMGHPSLDELCRSQSFVSDSALAGRKVVRLIQWYDP